MATRAKRELAAVPAVRFFGMVPGARSEIRAEMRMPVKEAYVQEEGLVHGGIISALADTAAVYLLLPTLRAGERLVSIEFKVNFLNPARVGDGDLAALATMVKRGKTVGVVEVAVQQGDRLIAKGLFTYLVSPGG
ncbi:MAG: PaaI family thioesterase [Calditrichaeota bacterium]|nr:MAG: PaaI family thioesterase [Calditrichota bacterium]